MSEPFPHSSHHSSQDEDNLSLIDLWNIIWRRKWLWLTLGPIAGIVGVIVALNSTEIYRSGVLLAPAEEEGGEGVAALAGQFGGLVTITGVSDTTTALATLKSRQFLLPYLKERNLATTLFHEEWDAESASWIKTNARRGPDGEPTDSELVGRFQQNILKVSQDEQSGLVTLGMEWEDPALITQWANDLSIRINMHLREKAKAKTERNLAYLKDQIEETQVLEIREALYSLIELQTQNAMLANAKEEFAFRIIDPAYIPENRIRPKRNLIVIASGLLGGFLGIFLCFVLHFVETAKIDARRAEE